MNVMRPQEFHQHYAHSFNTGDVKSIVRLYEPDATFVPQPDQVASGQSAIHEALLQFLAIKPAMNATTRYCIQCGDVALASASWQIKGTGPDGVPVDLQGVSVDLLRRQEDGSWLLVVDHPFGGT